MDKPYDELRAQVARIAKAIAADAGVDEDGETLLLTSALLLATMAPAGLVLEVDGVKHRVSRMKATALAAEAMMPFVRRALDGSACAKLYELPPAPSSKARRKRGPRRK